MSISQTRTDLALESLEQLKRDVPGIKKTERTEEGVTVTEVTIQNKEAAGEIGKRPGTYVTINLTPFRSVSSNFEGELSVVAKELAMLLPKEGLVLVVGLGNEEITPDAIGPNGSILLEMGGHANSMEEVIYAGELIGKSLANALAKIKA